MTSENSNWIVGEMGTITEILDGGEKVVIAFDGRDDDYTAFVGDFEIIGEEKYLLKVTRQIPHELISDFVQTKFGNIRVFTEQELDEEISLQDRRMYQWESNGPVFEIYTVSA